MKKWQIWTVASVLVVAVGLGCLFGGRAWGSSENDGAAGQSVGQDLGDGDRPEGMPGDGSRSGNGFGGGRGGGAVSGSIIAVDENSITVQTSDGSTKMILVGDSATISLVSQGSVSDLKTGEDVVVTGTANDDGTVTAISIRLGETFGEGVAPGGLPPADGTAPSESAPTS